MLSGCFSSNIPQSLWSDALPFHLVFPGPLFSLEIDGPVVALHLLNGPGWAFLFWS